MDTLIQIALIVLPAGAVLITTILFLRRQADIFRQFTERDLRNFQLELKKERQSYFLPHRAEAYQRVVLLMERITPNSLIMRVHNPAMPAKVIQSQLLDNIRNEFEHNIAQQLFISPKGWEMVKNSKEETIRIINLAGDQMDATAMSLDLCAKIMEIVAEIGETPTEITAKFLNRELQELF